MEDLMRTKDEVYNIICELNEDAHSEAYDSWTKADEEDSEELREEASETQAWHFRDMLEQYPGLLEEAKHYAQQDDEFNMDWEAWYQPYLDGDDK